MKPEVLSDKTCSRKMADPRKAMELNSYETKMSEDVYFHISECVYYTLMRLQRSKFSLGFYDK